MDERRVILSTEKYITGSSSIDRGIVSKDGKHLFENGDVDSSAFLLSVYQHFQFNYPKFYKMDNLSKLGWLCSEILLKDSFDKSAYQPEKIGLVLANRNSSLDDDIKYWDSVKEIASPSLFVYTLPNIVIGEICIRNGFKGEHAFFIQPDFDADFIAGQVNYLLDNDILDVCICGWVDFLEQDYKAVFYLVEKKTDGSSGGFSTEYMASVFKGIS